MICPETKIPAPGDIVGRTEWPPIFTKKELATALSCSTKHIGNLTNRGLLKSVKLGRSVRYRRDSVLRALEKMEAAG